MAKKALCPECGKIILPEIKEELRKVKLRGEEFEVRSSMPVCPECGKSFLMKGVENDSYTLATGLYRKKHNLLPAGEIRQIRERYRLSPKPFARLLGWGELTVYKYENGGVQDDAHDEVLKLIKEPENMKALYESKLINNLDPGEKTAFESNLDKLLGEINPYERIIRLKFGYPPDEFSGKRPFDLIRAVNMILKIIACSVKKHLFEVPLVKCMFYSDFINYRDNGISITGLQYANGPFGPIPNDYHNLLDYMLNTGAVKMEIIPFDFGEGHKYTAAADPDDSLFTGKELELFEEICSRLTPLGSKQLSDKTHKEVQGWKDTVEGQLISYKYAEKIKGL